MPSSILFFCHPIPLLAPAVDYLKKTGDPAHSVLVTIRYVYHLIARRPLPQFTSSTADRSELKFLRVNREGMNCLRMYLPYL